MGPFLLLAALAAATSPGTIAAGFIERYFAQYPTLATEAGRSDFDDKLEDLGPASLARWLAFLDQTEAQLGAPGDDSLDLEVLRHQIASERFTLVTRAAPARNPLFWTATLSNAAIYLLLREDQPLPARAAALSARARLLPGLVAQAKAALAQTSPALIAKEHAEPAARQARALAQLYQTGLPKFAPELEEPGQRAAAALNDLAAFLEKLPATGSPRLGKDYAEAFRIGLRTSDSPAVLLPRFEQDLAALRGEVAAYGRSVWRELVPGEPMPADDKAVARRLFAAIEEQHDTEVAPYAEFWKSLVPSLEALVREREVITLPEPRTLQIAVAPPWLLGQAYGGVFPAGAWRPEGQTLLLLPVPPGGATLAERVEFFRAFNRPFSKMIAAHEVLPGHYVQLKIAARDAHRIRALFPDQVYAEGWGTFVERVMLDQGWGGPRERLAHLKKQLENCARAIVDIRVHTSEVSKEQIARFVREEALQDPQLAANLWQRTLTSAPQIVTYHLGYRQIDALYQAARSRPGFRLRRFTDGLMRLGAVPLRHYE